MRFGTFARPAALTTATGLLLFSAASAVARSATTWPVIVGGQTPDVSVYANGFFPHEVTVRTGDTVTFQFAGFHNVTFLSGAAAPSFAMKDGNGYYGNPEVFLPAGDGTYDGTGFRNSGVPPDEKPFSYSLTFTKPGRYEYACTLHPGMDGFVNVVDGAVTEKPEGVLARGRAEQTTALTAGTKAYTALNPHATGTNVTVPLIGSREERFSLLRFTHDPLVISVGTTVTWTIQDPFEVHTVTFASGAQLPEFFVPQTQPGGPPKLLLNPLALTPTSTATYDGTGFVNSGLLALPSAPGNPTSSFALTFTKPGRYVYWCLVHDHENQEGVIIVK